MGLKLSLNLVHNYIVQLPTKLNAPYKEGKRDGTEGEDDEKQLDNCYVRVLKRVTHKQYLALFTDQES